MPPINPELFDIYETDPSDDLPDKVALLPDVDLPLQPAVLSARLRVEGCDQGALQPDAERLMQPAPPPAGSCADPSADHDGVDLQLGGDVPSLPATFPAGSSLPHDELCKWFDDRMAMFEKGCPTPRYPFLESLRDAHDLPNVVTPPPTHRDPPDGEKIEKFADKPDDRSRVSKLMSPNGSSPADKRPRTKRSKPKSLSRNATGKHVTT